MREIPPPVFSKRSFLFFILLAPASFAAVAAIVLTLQYKQFQAMVAPATTVAEFVPTSESRQRLDGLRASIQAFSDTLESPVDTLRLSPDDLTVLAAASPVTAREHIRFRFAAKKGLLVAESSQRVSALNGRFAWIFKRISKTPEGWLNARLEGLPELKRAPLALDFAVENGFLNDGRVPRAALIKRGGLSPKDFLDPVFAPEYYAFLNAIDTVYFDVDAVVLVRR
jgi:hypothetical protein